MFLRFQSIADWCWSIVQDMDHFERQTIGTQLVRSVDSVGANVVEGDGRHGDKDSLRFFVIAIASAREAKYWLSLCLRRNIIPAEECRTQLLEIETAAMELNKLIKYRRSRITDGSVRESIASYGPAIT